MKNGYIGYHKSRRVEVFASSSYEAQKLAAEKLKLPAHKRCEVAVVLATKGGEQVVQAAAGVCP